jgi:hypothetical protein
MPQLRWEQLENEQIEPSQEMITINRTERARVPGGWLVRTYSATMSTVKDTGFEGAGVGHGVGVGLGITFVPDPEHAWA